jgi:hypothetical protein
MTTLERLEGWRQAGNLREDQFRTISALVRKERFSVFLELNILLYLGVLSIVAGAGWTIRAYFTSLGNVAIVGTLSVLVAACFLYCFSRATPYANLQVESPNLGFDYILYLGCLLLGIEFGYLETQFHLLQAQWDYYLLFSALVYFASAYRFDNRFVLSLALATLAAWFGVKTSRFYLDPSAAFHTTGLTYGVTSASAGLLLFKAGFKKHFLDTYLHIAANVLLAALVAGVGENTSWLYFPAALAVSGAAFWGGLRYRRFAFVAYGVLYGYIALAIEVLRGNRNFMVFMLYLFVTGTMVVIGTIVLARRLGRES